MTNQFGNHLRNIALRSAIVIVLLLLVSGGAQAQDPNLAFCTNAVPPCNPNVPPKPGEPGCYRPPARSPKCERCKSCVRSPCHVESGAYTTSATDLSIRTVGFPITVSRLYESTHQIDGESGYGWVSSLSARLYYTERATTAGGAGTLEADVRLLNGVLYRFVENADGTFTPPDGRFDKLVRNPDETWDLWMQRTRSRLRFSATGNLIEIVDDYGNRLVWSYVMDRLDRITDASGSGRYLQIDWGADGRISGVVDPIGRRVEYTYVNGVLSTVSNPLAQLTKYKYEPGKYVPRLTEINDHWNRNITTIQYVAADQDRVRSYSEKGETYTYTYGYNNVATTTAKSDSSGNTWVFPFGNSGLVADDLPPGGGTGAHTDYDANGLVTLRRDPMGVRTRFTYDSRGNIVTETRDELGQAAVEWRTVYDPNFPDLATSVTPYIPGTNQIHPHWQARKIEYYPPGSVAPGAMHKIYEVDDDGVTSRVKFTYTYDAQGRELTETLANGALRTFSYDAFGNLERVEAPANNAAGHRPVTSYTYDDVGRKRSKTDPEGNVTTFEWDALNRLISSTAPAPLPSSERAFTTTIQYDELDADSRLVTRMVSPNGATIAEARDAYGQLVRRTDAAGHFFSMTWAKGLQTESVDWNGYVTTFSYDARRRLQRITYPDGTYEAYTHRNDNQVVSFRDRAGALITYDYDPFKRMKSASYPGGASASWTFQGQKLMSWTDTRAQSAGTWNRTWDASFQIASETQGSNGTVSWTYDLLGKPMTEKVAGGAEATYAYYDDGSLRTIEWSPVLGSFAHEYDLAGHLTQIRFPNGQTRSLAYDGQGRTVSIANVHPATGNLATFSYGHDVDAFTGEETQLGYLTTISASLPALSMTDAVTRFDYDARGMITRAEYPAGAPYNSRISAWTYDAAGNRTSETVNGVTSHYTYRKYGSNPRNSSVLESDGQNTYAYDDAGNTVTRSGSRGNYGFAWDAEHRLLSVTGNESETYHYDPIQRRVATTSAAGTTKSLYSGFQVIQESGASNAQYLFAEGYDRPLAMVRGGQIYYYAVDGLGSVVAMNDQDGTVVNSHAYDAWGVPVARNVTVASPFGFTARPVGAAGLADHRNRSYESATGSFRSFDPLITIAGRNVAARAADFVPAMFAYAYADGRPTMLVDPLGLQAEEGDEGDAAQREQECIEGCYAKAWERVDGCEFRYASQLVFCIGYAAKCKFWPTPPCWGRVGLCFVTALGVRTACLFTAYLEQALCVDGCACPI